MARIETTVEKATSVDQLSTEETILQLQLHDDVRLGLGFSRKIAVLRRLASSESIENKKVEA